jgi:protein gp37
VAETSIQWTDHSTNPIRARNLVTGDVGHFCEKISPGCGHCYSSEWNEHRFGTGLPFLPVHRPEVELFLDEGKLREVLRRRKPTKFFWCDMTDLFLAHHPDAWIDRCFAAMALTPQHTHQVLTKRPERMGAYLGSRATRDRIARAVGGLRRSFGLPAWDEDGVTGGEIEHGQYWPLPNVWAMTSVEDQQRADERIPHLLRVPAAVRGLSVEPLLGPVDLTPWLPTRYFCPRHGTAATSRPKGEWSIHPSQGYAVCQTCRMRGDNGDLETAPGIHWVIVGGESGHGARPCHVEWVRGLVRQCSSAGVACFVKQLGAVPVVRATPEDLTGPAAIAWDRETFHEWPEGTRFGNRTGLAEFNGRQVLLRDPKGGDPAEWPQDLQVRQFPGPAGIRPRR